MEGIKVFYDEYFRLNIADATQYKIKYLQSILKENCIYKFIAFDDNEVLNNSKLLCLQNDQLWFSYYRYLNDSTEFDIIYNKKYVSKKLKSSEDKIEYFLNLIIEIYDVCSFTYQYQDYMWREYANDGNGICLEFEVSDLDMLFPVEYKKKNEIDFNKMIIRSFSNFNKSQNGTLNNDPLSLYPWVVKNPQNGSLDSTKEKEVRILYSPYDNMEFNNGIIDEKIKEIKKYHGLNVDYEKINLRLKRIIVGAKCDTLLMNKINKICAKKGIDIIFQDE